MPRRGRARTSSKAPKTNGAPPDPVARRIRQALKDPALANLEALTLEGPEALQAIEGDQMLDELLSAFGVEPEWLRGIKKRPWSRAGLPTGVDSPERYAAERAAALPVLRELIKSLRDLRADRDAYLGTLLRSPVLPADLEMPGYRTRRTGIAKRWTDAIYDGNWLNMLPLCEVCTRPVYARRVETRKNVRFYDLRATGITWRAVRGDQPSRSSATPGTSASARRRSTCAKVTPSASSSETSFRRSPPHFSTVQL
jgi:hypothetical protein